MAALAPAVCFALLALAFRGGPSKSAASSGWRESLLKAAVLWGVAATAVTELLSAFGLLRSAWVTGLWLLAAALPFSFLLLRRRFVGLPPASTQTSSERTPAGLVLAAGSILALVALTALAAPPNTWDSLAYHMPRVMHWIQNQSVAHYPTHILRQLYLGPWSEFAIAQLQMLTGSDRLANLVQWGSFTGSAAAASLIARELGADRTVQAASALIAVTVPMAILEGSSTQTDLVVAFWVLTFVWAVLSLRRTPDSLPLLFWAGASLGLALLTKPTAYLFAAPFLLWLFLIWARGLRWRAWKPVLAVAAVVVALNAPHWSRNLALFGSPLGVSQGAVNERRGITALASNILRNAAIHGLTPAASINRALERGVERLHGLLDADVNDPKTTWKGSEFHLPGRFRGTRAFDGDEAVYAMFHEDTAGNLAHFLLVLAALGLLVARRELRRRRPLPAFTASILAGFLLFCWVLKWQPWHSRLHLTLFLIASPLVAITLSNALPTRLFQRLCAGLVLLALPWTFLNATRPLVGESSVWKSPRIAQYFNARPDLFGPYERAVRFLSARGCRQVGLILRPDEAEYALWILLEQARPPVERIEHVAVVNLSRSAGRRERMGSFMPCAVMTLQPERGEAAASSSQTANVREEVWPGGRILVQVLPSSVGNGTASGAARPR